MPSGSIYTFIGVADQSNGTRSIETSQGVVALGQYGYFLPSEYQAAVGQGLILQAGIVGPAAAGPVGVSYAILGTDSAVGGPGGSPLTSLVALKASLATAQPGTALLLGASIEANEGGDWPIGGTPSGQPSPSGASALGPLRWASWLNGAALRFIKNAAAAGVTSDQQLVNIQNVASAQYAVGLSPAPGFIYLGHVTGDDPGNLTTNQSVANDLAIYMLLRATYPYSVIILPTLPGVNIPAGTGNAALRNALNPQRRDLALSNPNTLLFDFEAAFTDPITGLPVSGYSQDNIHPNPTGAMNVGKPLSALIGSRLPGKSMVNDYANDSRVSVANGGWTTDATMRGTPGANTSATNWTFSGPAGATRALVARSDQFGNWQEMVYGGTGGLMKLQRAFPAIFPQNAVIQAECELMYLGTFPATGITEATLSAVIGNSGFTTIGSTRAGGNTLGNNGPFGEVGNGTVVTLRTPPLVVPTGMSLAASICQFQLTGTATAGSIRVGRLSILRLA